MRLLRLPLFVLSIAPLISLYRGYRTAQGQIHGLLSDPAALHRVMPYVVVAGAIYLLVAIVLLIHLARNSHVGLVGKVLWAIAMLIVPMMALPAYLLLHARQ